MEIHEFIWGYQVHFRTQGQVLAKSLFREIGVRSDPQLLLIALSRGGVENADTICVEPETDSRVRSQHLEEWSAEAEQCRSVMPEGALLQSSPVAQERQDEWVDRESLRRSLKNLLCTQVGFEERERVSVGMPALRDGFLVFPVLVVMMNAELDWSVFQQGTLQLSELRSIPLARSVPEACTMEFLEQLRRELERPDAGLVPFAIDAEELRKRAGKRVLQDALARLGGQDSIFMGDVYAMACAVSDLGYEGGEVRGSIYFSGLAECKDVCELSFVDPPRIGDHRYVRKLVEVVASGELDLISDGVSVIGVAKNADVSSTQEPGFEVRFRGRGEWNLLVSGAPVAKFENGYPRMPALRIDMNALRMELNRIVGITDSAVQERILAFVSQAIEEPGGTILVVSDHAQEEAERLSQQCSRTLPCGVDAESIVAASKIDGAILVDELGQCHAIGVILDGLASGDADRSRGARYNSTSKYLATSTHDAIAVVISEDGYCDLLPKMMPPVLRAHVEDRVNWFVDAVSRKHVARNAIPDTYRAVREVEFYLLEDDVSRLNAALDQLDGSEVGSADDLHFHVAERFSVNEKMDPDFYYSDIGS